jgi:hypothetical protein
MRNLSERDCERFPPMRIFVFSLAAAFISGATPAAAQGVFDPGVLTGTLSADHVRQSEEARAKGESSSEAREVSSAKARANCARRGELARRYGRDDPRLRQINAMCRQLGYP